MQSVPEPSDVNWLEKARRDQDGAVLQLLYQADDNLSLTAPPTEATRTLIRAAIVVLEGRTR